MKNLEWLKEEVKNYIEPYDKEDWLSYKAGTTDVAELILGYIDQVEQPELPEIPDYVAEHIKKRRESSYPLYQAIRIVRENSRFIGTELSLWLSSNENQETFAKAWVNGYTVGKKKYTARLRVIGENIASYLRTQSENNRLDNLEIGSKYINEDYRHLSEFTKEELEEVGLSNNPDWEIKENSNEEEY